MTARPVRYLLVGVIVFAAGLLIFLPARVAAGWISGDSGLTLGGVTGTLFSGHAAYVSGAGGTVENLDWTLNALPLLIGSVSADISVNSDRDGFSADISRSLFGTLHIDDLTGSASSGWLGKLAGYTFMPLAGDVTLNIDAARFDGNYEINAVSGHIGLDNGRWQLLDPPLKLGQVQTVLDHTKDGVRTRVTDSKGPLAITGQITIGAARRYELDVRMRARAGADKRLGNMLDQLGKADAQGWHHIKEHGTL